LTRRRTAYRSIASLQRDNRVCRACVEAGYELNSPPVVQPYAGQRAYIFGQAPGPEEGLAGLPWQGRAGRTLRAWLGMDAEVFFATFYCASVTRCDPGRAPSGRGDRVPSPPEQELCAFWHSWEQELVRPVFVVAVGRLAIDRLLPAAPLAALVGRRFPEEPPVIPLPHPSGASAWPYQNRALVERAVELIHAELAAIGSRRRSSAAPAR
jgi:uracil-DNA glycosylase family 4